jgi:hypothetical protein
LVGYWNPEEVKVDHMGFGLVMQEATEEEKKEEEKEEEK